MTDPRLEQFAADARSRGWHVSWHEGHDRTDLLVNPTLTPLHPGSSAEWLDLNFCMGLGVAIGGAITVCMTQGWTGGFLIPWDVDERNTDKFWSLRPDQELEYFPTVTTFDEALVLFDAAVDRYLTGMREYVLLDPDTRDLDLAQDWAPVTPLAATGGLTDGNR